LTPFTPGDGKAWVKRAIKKLGPAKEAVAEAQDAVGPACR
jgi:hypothetical protein